MTRTLDFRLEEVDGYYKLGFKDRLRHKRFRYIEMTEKDLWELKVILGCYKISLAKGVLAYMATQKLKDVGRAATPSEEV